MESEVGNSKSTFFPKKLYNFDMMKSFLSLANLAVALKSAFLPKSFFMFKKVSFHDMYM